MKTSSDMKSGCASRSKKPTKADECTHNTSSCSNTGTSSKSTNSSSHSSNDRASSAYAFNTQMHSTSASASSTNSSSNSYNTLTSCMRKNASASSQTTLVVKADVGWGNTLYVRGEGAGLSWDKGVPMQNNGASEWVWQATTTGTNTSNITVKLLVNDQVWSTGENLTIQPGQQNVVAPSFSN